MKFVSSVVHNSCEFLGFLDFLWRFPYLAVRIKEVVPKELFLFLNLVVELFRQKNLVSRLSHTQLCF